MSYPKKFAKLAKELVPEDKHLHTRIKENSLEVGRILRRKQMINMSSTKIFALLDDGQTEDLRIAAKNAANYSELYRIWRGFNNGLGN